MITLEERAWVFLAACAQPGVPAALWETECEQSSIGLHICGHCPVFDQCAAAVAQLAGTPDAYRDVVVAGVRYGNTGRPTKTGQEPARACWLCRPDVLVKPLLTFRDYGADSDAACGTASGHARHRRRREAACEPCRAWRRRQYRDERLQDIAAAS